MTRAGQSHAGKFCTGFWQWDNAAQLWVWCGNCSPGVIGDPFNGYKTILKPQLPPGTPPTSGSGNNQPLPGAPAPGPQQPPPQIGNNSPKSGDDLRNPITGPEEEQPPPEGVCGNPITGDKRTEAQSGMSLEQWAGQPEIWQEVNVPAMSSLTPNTDGTDPFVYKNRPYLEIDNGRVVVRWPGVADGARVFLPYNVRPHVALVDNRDEIPTTVARNIFIIGAGLNPDNGQTMGGGFGIGLAKSTASKFVAAGWLFELDTGSDGDNPDLCITPKDEEGADGTSDAQYFIKSPTKVDGNLTLPKTSGKGIRVDVDSPSFGWRDLIGEIAVRGSGGNDPTFQAYRGNIRQYFFDASDEVFVNYHIPHDYLPGSDIFLHFHWSQAEKRTNGASTNPVTGGSVTWGYEVTYAKGHQQQAFITPVSGTVVQTASTTIYWHHIAEVQISAASPSASQIDSDDLEVDGVIQCRAFLSANNMTVGAGNIPAPALHYVDIHYQSTNMPTKEKAPDFYT